MHRAGAAPLVRPPHRWLKLQQPQHVEHRDSLAEQLNVYARHSATSWEEREEEPVLETPLSASLANKADSTVRRFCGR
jgi:hypothetical protein